MSAFLPSVSAKGEEVDALFTIDLSSSPIGSEYKHVINDLLRMLCIQATIQVMLYFSGGEGSFVTREFVLLLVYVEMGVLLYWLVVRKLWRFT
jgi:hypothetical protein